MYVCMYVYTLDDEARQGRAYHTANPIRHPIFLIALPAVAIYVLTPCLVTVIVT